MLGQKSLDFIESGSNATIVVHNDNNLRIFGYDNFIGLLF